MIEIIKIPIIMVCVFKRFWIKDRLHAILYLLKQLVDATIGSIYIPTFLS